MKLTWQDWQGKITFFNRRYIGGIPHPRCQGNNEITSFLWREKKLHGLHCFLGRGYPQKIHLEMVVFCFHCHVSIYRDGKIVQIQEATVPLFQKRCWKKEPTSKRGCFGRMGWNHWIIQVVGFPVFLMFTPILGENPNLTHMFQITN